MTRPLRLAIQKSGRLSEQSFALLSDCDLHFPSTKSGRAIRCAAINFPLEILLVRDDDIPQYVNDRVVDIGIVGENVLWESDYSLQTVQQLGFGHCKLSFAVPKGSAINSVKDLQNKKIATSYPKSTSEFLSKHNIKADIHFLSGSVEIAPSLGIADAISDLVGTGSTLIQNGLTELSVIFSSQAALVSAHQVDPQIQPILERVLFRIRSVEKGRNLKYLMLNCQKSDLSKVTELIEGEKSPTVLELAQKDWCAVHAVVPEEGLWDLIEQLKTVGAEGILVTQIEKKID